MKLQKRRTIYIIFFWYRGSPNSLNIVIYATMSVHITCGASLWSLQNLVAIMHARLKRQFSEKETSVSCSGLSRLPAPIIPDIMRINFRSICVYFRVSRWSPFRCIEKDKKRIVSGGREMGRGKVSWNARARIFLRQLCMQHS